MMSTNKYRRNDGVRKSLFGKHQSNNCCRQESSKDVRDRKCDENQVIRIVAKILLNMKGKRVTGKPGRHHHN